MQFQDQIEYLIQHELKGRCTSCAYEDRCTYRKNTDKVVIQCELYQSRDAIGVLEHMVKPSGLCMSCCSADACGLPQKNEGIWHCKSYE